METRKRQALAIILAIVTFVSTLSFPMTVYAEENHFQTQSWLNDLTVVKGGDLTLKAAVIGDDLSKVTYSWRKVKLKDYYVDDYNISVESSEVIDGANQSTLTLENVTEPCDYSCVAYDGYGNYAFMYFHVGLENHFAAKAHTEDDAYSNPMVSYGGSTTLQVDVFGDDLDHVTYEWYRAARQEGQEYVSSSDYQLVSEATGNTCQVKGVTDVLMYECRIRDGYGNSAKIMINVYVDNHLTVDSPVETIAITPGQTILLEALVSADDTTGISYQWSLTTQVEDESGSTYPQSYEISGATESTYETVVSGPCTYYCTIRDRYGNYAYKNIDCIIDNHFSAEAKENSFIVDMGQTATLIANVKADMWDKLTFKWGQVDEYLGNDGEPYSVWTWYTEVTGDTFVTPVMTGRATFVCMINDGYGSEVTLYYYVNVINDFDAYAVNSEVEVKKGEDAELEVVVSGTAANNVQYAWYVYQPVENASGSISYTKEVIPGETENKMVIENATKAKMYACMVTDLNTNNVISVYFTLSIENHLMMSPSHRSLSVAAGECATLTVKAHADDESVLALQWYYTVEEYDPEQYETLVTRVPIKGATGNTFKTNPITEEVQILCEVTDVYGNTQTSDFTISIRNQLQAKPVSYTREFPYGESVTLKVEASALDPEGITYEWRRSHTVYDEEGVGYYDGEVLTEDGEGTDTFVTEPITESWEYSCVVTDAYGNSDYLTIPVYVENHFRFSKKPNTKDTFDYYDLYYLGEDGTVTLDFKARVDQTEPVRYILTSHGNASNGFQSETLWDGARKLFVIDKTGYYDITMIDAYGRDISCNFVVFDDPSFAAEAVGGSEKVVPVGENVTLQVSTNADPKDLTYQWMKSEPVYDKFGSIIYYDYIMLEGEEASLVVKNVTEKGKYFCTVRDENGNYGAEVEFTVYAGAKQTSSITSDHETPVNETLWVPEGETLTLRAVTEGLGENLTYCWMEEVYTEDVRYVYDWTFTDVKGSELVLKPVADGLMHCYECTITDEQGRTEKAVCDVYVKKDCTVTFQANGGSGSMANDIAQKYFSYQLPECKFAAPSGMVFAGWEVKGELYEEGETLVAGGNITVKATWKTTLDTSSPVLLGAEAKANGITFTWKANAGVFTYAIFRKEEGGKWIKIATTTGTGDDGVMAEAGSTCSYVDGNVEVGKTYIYTARGINANGKYITNYDMNGVTVTMAEVLDASSPVLGGATVGADGITVTWTANSGVPKYAVFRKVAGGKWIKIAETTGSGTEGVKANAGSTCSYVDGTAEVGTTYTYTVRGLDESGKYVTNFNAKGVTATMTSVEVLDASSPVLGGATAGANGITVTWTANSGVPKYAVFRKVAGGKWKKVAETTGSGNEGVKADAGSTCSYLDGTAEAGTSYTYTVRGLDESGKYVTNFNAKGVTATMTSVEVLDASSPVLGGATAGANGITVTWTANSGVPKYAVFRKVTGGKWKKIAETTGSGNEGVKADAGSTCSYLDGTAEAGTTYTYTVRGLDEDGKYVTNFDANGVTATMTIPEVLDASSPLLGNAVAGANGITVTWTANSGVPKYAVFRKVTGGKWTKVAETTGSGNEGVKATAGSACSFVDGSVAAGKTYIYTVRGLGEDGKYVTNFDANGMSATAK